MRRNLLSAVIALTMFGAGGAAAAVDTANEKDKETTAATAATSAAVAMSTRRPSWPTGAMVGPAFARP